MLTLKEASDIITDEIERVKKECIPHKPELLYSPINYILSLGGKRIRPSLALMSYTLFEENLDEILMPAIGLEVFHNFTLVHDDIMDKSDIRRGQKTVHKKWDENVGILSGDAMMIKAYELICRTGGKNLSKVLDLFNTTALQVCEGQQLDMDFENRLDVSEEEYLEMIKLKTAVLIAASLKLGAIIGGADKKTSETLYEIGYNVGMAFQLQDDLLDTYGSEKVFGKPIGGDIYNDKKTFLLIKAYNNADSYQITLLQKWQGESGDDIRKQKIADVKEVYEKLNIKSEVNSIIQRYFEKAYEGLENLNFSKEKLVGLYDFVDSLKVREK